MTTTPVLPKWFTPDRRAYLLRLWLEYGNKCLKGHPVSLCSNPEHYTYIQNKVVTIGKAVAFPCHDRDKNPIRDKEGNQLYITLYKPVSSSVSKVKLCRLYDLKVSECIADWIAEDRAIDKAERETLHRTAERTEPLRGRFSGVSRDIFHDKQPQYYTEGLGISGLTLTPFAKVRLSSSYARLYVDLGDSLRDTTKNQRRKAIRYGKPLPKSIQERIRLIVGQAVRHYLNH